ncbi:tetratricopeptide repeat protein [Planctomicrobium sp. SH661]|uniref:tetratricopeptide repeat protein n=1 Tax=Planctomicrobium sp. SH661 TaxID=3448124 RepID=UPI003F5C6B86
MTIQQRPTTLGWSGYTFFTLSLMASASVPLQAFDGNSPEKPAAVKPSRLEGLEFQPGDEPLKTFQPERPAGADVKLRGEALARFMTGRIQQEKGEFSAALASYLAAIEKDPTAIEPYQSALPILLQRQENEQARKLALTAAEKNPLGYELVLAMAAIFARQDRVSEGVSLIQEAMKLAGSQKNSLRELSLHRDLGLYSRLQGNFKEAAAEYEIVFQAVTGDQLDEETRKKVLVDPGQMFDEFGDVFLKAENPELALKAFDEASKHRESRPGLNSYNLATVFQQTGNSQKALDELQGYFDAQLQTRGRAAYDLLKSLLADLKRENELIPKLEAMLKQDEHNDSLRYFLADELLSSGNLAGAETLYLNGRKEVTDPRGLVGMFSIYRQNKNSEKLLGILGKTFSSVPRAEDQATLQQMAPDVQALANRFEAEITALEEDKEAFGELTKFARTQETDEDAKVDFLTAYLLGKLAAEGDYTEDASHFYRLAISMRNDPPAALYRELAIHLLDAERAEEAIALLNEAKSHTSSTLQRDRWNFLYLLSYAYAIHGETDQAIAAIREAQAVQPNQPLLHYQEAWVLYHARRWDEALARFDQFIKNFPNDKDHVMKCRFHISNIYVEQGDMARGEKILEDVLASDPENPQANNDLGYLYADQGKNLERAEAMIRKALAKEPDNHAYQDSLGWVLYRLGKYPEAVAEMEKATADEKIRDATLMDHLGDCLEKVGRHEEAVAAWKKGLESEQAKKVPNEKILKSLKSKLNIEDAQEPSEKPENPGEKS